MSDGAVYVQTNESSNRVIAFHRAGGGALTQIDSYATGGAGDGQPHLTSQGSVTLTSDANHLLVTNAASDDVTLFAVGPDGGLELVGTAPVGPAPKSVTERDGLLYVLATGAPAVIGLRIGAAGLERIGEAVHSLSPEADPAQVGFTPDGSALVVTERGTDAITLVPVASDGTLGTSRTIPSSGPTPYGFAVTAAGTLVVTEAFRAQKGAAAASSYAVTGMDLTPTTASVGNGRSEICWAVVTPDGRFAFTTNFADGAISRYAIAGDGQLSLDDATAAFSVDGRPGLRDEGLSADGRYLYAIDADAGTVFGWQVGADATLTPVGAWDGLPATVAGLAAR